MIIWIWYYPILKSSDVAYWETSNFNKILLILWIIYGLGFNCLFRLLKLLIKVTQFYLGLYREKYGATLSELVDLSRYPSRTKRSTYFLNIVLCTFGTLYGLEHIGYISFLILSILDLFSRWQSFQQTNIRIFAIILAIHYIVLLSDVGIGFP